VDADRRVAVISRASFTGGGREDEPDEAPVAPSQLARNTSRLLGVSAPVVRLPFAPGEPLAGSVLSLADLARRRSLAVLFYGGVAAESAGERQVGVVQDVRMDGWRECEPELAELGFEVVGVSSQSSEEQVRFALDRMLSFVFLSDSELLLADELGLPTRRSTPDGERVYEPLTMLFEEERVAWVFYPLERPECDARLATERIRACDA
jgi:peroxiredoxin